MTNTFFVTTADYEHVAIVLLLLFTFVIGLKKLPIASKSADFILDRDYSSALKGIGVVLILMGHYGQMEINRLDGSSKSIDSIVAMITANVALVWFMFISGYGLTVSKKNISHHIRGCVRRLCKVFFPMLFVFILSLVLYVFIKEPKVLVTAKDLCIPDEIGMLPYKLTDNLYFVLSGIVRWYWYPWCAIMLYICFYFGDFIACKLKANGGVKHGFCYPFYLSTIY